MELKPADVLISHEQIAERIKEIAQEISYKYAGQDLMMIGILRGAVIFMSDLARAIDPSVGLTMEFMKASSYGASTQSSGKVAITQQPTMEIKDRQIIIVEDIVDTGLTLKRLREYFAAHGAKSVEVCVLLDKKDRRVVDVPVEYTGFVIPDEFVVGYGNPKNKVIGNCDVGARECALYLARILLNMAEEVNALSREKNAGLRVTVEGREPGLIDEARRREEIGRQRDIVRKANEDRKTCDRRQRE